MGKEFHRYTGYHRDIMVINRFSVDLSLNRDNEDLASSSLVQVGLLF